MRVECGECVREGADGSERGRECVLGSARSEEELLACCVVTLSCSCACAQDEIREKLAAVYTEGKRLDLAAFVKAC